MRIFLTGSTGFVGGHLLRELSRQGHAITCLVRPGRKPPQLPGVSVVSGRWIDSSKWKDRLQGHDVAINAVSGARQTLFGQYSRVYTKSAIAYFDAAQQMGVRRVVQLSAFGAEEGAQTRLQRALREADRHLETLPLSFVILRPTLIYGSGDRHSQLWKWLAALPLTPVPGKGLYQLQPVHVFDVSQALTIAAEAEGEPRLTVNMGGGQKLSINELMDALAYRQAKPNGARKVRIPMPLMWLVALFTDCMAGNGPITIDELRLLRRGMLVDNSEFTRLFGFAPRPFI